MKTLLAQSANKILKAVFWFMAVCVISGCAPFHSRISGRAWTQTVAIEQEEHQNLNQTSIFGGN